MSRGKGGGVASGFPTTEDKLMKAEKTASSKKSKTRTSAENRFHANTASTSFPKEKAGKSGNRTTSLSRQERNFPIESATDYRGERRHFFDGAPEEHWLEAEIEVELDRLRKRDSLPPD
jgi:hypothetical protein